MLQSSRGRFIKGIYKGVDPATAKRAQHGKSLRIHSKVRATILDILETCDQGQTSDI